MRGHLLQRIFLAISTAEALMSLHSRCLHASKTSRRALPLAKSALVHQTVSRLLAHTAHRPLRPSSSAYTACYTLAGRLQSHIALFLTTPWHFGGMSVGVCARVCGEGAILMPSVRSKRGDALARRGPSPLQPLQATRHLLPQNPQRKKGFCRPTEMPVSAPKW